MKILHITLLSIIFDVFVYLCSFLMQLSMCFRRKRRQPFHGGGQLVRSGGLKPRNLWDSLFAASRQDKLNYWISLLVPFGGLKLTRTTDLTLIRRVL